MHLIADLGQPAIGSRLRAVKPINLRVGQLTDEDESDALAFLARRPTHTFGMAGFIRDNGVASPDNRGTFYCCLDREGQIEGLALIGHAVLFEADSEAAIEAFANLVPCHPEAFLVLAEQEKVKRFCRYYSNSGRVPRLTCREILLEKRWPVEALETVPELRPASLDDFEMVVKGHALLGIEERGLNPLEVDPVGFRSRCRRRIEMGRTWVWTEGHRLIFKADVVADTPYVNYIEGVWVNPGDRGQGHGLRCISQLNRTLLRQTRSVCLFVSERRPDAQHFYKRAGFKPIGYYETAYL